MSGIPKQQYNPKARPVPHPVIPKEEIPGYEVLAGNYSWVPDYLECFQLRSRVHVLSEKVKQIQDRPQDKEAFKVRVKHSHEKRLQDRQGCLTEFLTQERRVVSEDPLKYLHLRIKSGKYPGPKHSPYFEWQEIERAIDAMAELPKAIGDKERAKALKEITEEIASLELTINALSPSRFFVKSHGSVVVDARDGFVQRWIDVQNETRGMCNVRGLVPSGAEKKAWETLGLSVNPYGRYEPVVDNE